MMTNRQVGYPVAVLVLLVVGAGNWFFRGSSESVTNSHLVEEKHSQRARTTPATFDALQPASRGDDKLTNSARAVPEKEAGLPGRDLFVSFATGLPVADVVRVARAQHHFAPQSHITLFVAPGDISSIKTALQQRKIPADFIDLLDPSPLFKGDPMWDAFNAALRKQRIKSIAYRRACYIYTKRFFTVREYLRAHEERFDRVIFADARDLILQSDPFDQIKDPKGVYAFTEHQSFKADPKFNQVWARQCYGDDWVSELLDKKIVCAGVLMGGTEGILKYFDAFVEEFGKRGPCTASTDTAIHGRLLRKILPNMLNGPNVHIVPGETGKSLHLPMPAAWNGAISIDKKDVVRNEAGEPYSLVHLADRNKGLFGRYSKRWS
eukprot:m.462605 g.462605  ORF g.462605 m.462605 type:complete len:379 (-) comp22718_c0_seq1:14-1150(-)